MRIMIVDDDSEMRAILSALISRHDREVVLAADGLEAVRIFQIDPKFDSALIDIGIPKLSGIEVCTAIKKMSKSTRVIIMSGNINSENAKEALTAGADELFPKPFKPAELFKVLNLADLP